MPFEPIYSPELDTVSNVLNQLDEAKTKLPGLIFNYPPIPLWKPKELPFSSGTKIWDGSDSHSHNLYIHIPFCRQKCSFCYYSVVPGAEDEYINDYLSCLEKEASYFVENGFRERNLDTIFIGGGTPSLLNEKQICRLMENVVSKFDLSKIREITFECAPDSITAEKLSILHSYGITRVSMGVQSFDREVLKRTRRGDKVETVIDRYYDIVDAGIEKINIDLIAGVEEESLDSMKRTINILTELNPRPTQVTLFTLSVRKGSINQKYLGTDPVSQFQSSLKNYLYARDRLKKLGYWQYSRNLFPTGDKIFLYQDNIWGRNGYVLALGVSGYSHTQTAVYQNTVNAKKYIERINSNILPIEKMYQLSAEENLRRHLVLAMKHTRLDLDEVVDMNPNSIELINSFEPIFEALVEQKLIERSGPILEYTTMGIAQADKYARLFFSEDVNTKLTDMDFSCRQKSDAFNFTV